MVSYADMMSLLLCFFVVLYATTSSSGPRQTGHQAARERSQLRNDGWQQAGMPDSGGERHRATAADAERLAEAQEQVQRILDSLHQRFGPEYTISNWWVGGPHPSRSGRSTGLPRVEATTRGTRFPRGPTSERGSGAGPPEPGAYVLPAGRIFFAEGSADLTDVERQKLRMVADELAGKTQKIEIRGHASRLPLPPDAKYQDRTDLAYARCRTVQAELIGLGVDPRRIRLGVAGASEPLAVGQDQAQMRMCSRVDIHLLNEWVQQPAEEQQAPEQ
jgi:chemotaxis protein MotB